MGGDRDRRMYKRDDSDEDRYRRRRVKDLDNEDRVGYRDKSRTYESDRRDSRHDSERREVYRDYDRRDARNGSGRKEKPHDVERKESRRHRRPSRERKLSPSHDSKRLKERRSKREKSPRHEERDSNKDKRQKREKQKAKDNTPRKADFSADITPEDLQLMQAMGVPFGFQSSQGKHVEDDESNAGAIRTRSLRQARQFMNRKGGFNRPLPVEKTGRRVVRD